MVSMGKYGGTFVRSNSQGTTQITFGSRTTQSNANGIFGQQNNVAASKNSVSDIRRMLSRDIFFRRRRRNRPAGRISIGNRYFVIKLHVEELNVSRFSCIERHGSRDIYDYFRPYRMPMPLIIQGVVAYLGTKSSFFSKLPM